MARRVVILGEGDEDIGVPRGTRRIPCAFEGDLPRALRRIVQEEGGSGLFGYDAHRILDVVHAIPRVGRPTRAGGKSKDLRDACMTVLRDRADSIAIVAVIDARRSELDQLRLDARDIVAQCYEQNAVVPVVVGLAVHEVEAWLLADPAARMGGLGAAHDVIRVEEMTDPKSVWAMLAGQSEMRPAFTIDAWRDEQRRAAWESMRSRVVSAACPLGFAAFHAATLSALVERLASPRARGAS